MFLRVLALHMPRDVPGPRGTVVAPLHRTTEGPLSRVFPHMRRQMRRLRRSVRASLPRALRTRGTSMLSRMLCNRNEEKTQGEDEEVEQKAERGRRTLKGFSPVWVRMCRLRCPEPLAA